MTGVPGPPAIPVPVPDPGAAWKGSIPVPVGYPAFPAPMPAPIPPGPKPAITNRKAKPGQAPALGMGARQTEQLPRPKGSPPSGVEGCGGMLEPALPQVEMPVQTILPGAGCGSGRVLAESQPASRPLPVPRRANSSQPRGMGCQESCVAPSRVHRHHGRARHGSPEGPPHPGSRMPLKPPRVLVATRPWQQPAEPRGATTAERGLRALTVGQLTSAVGQSIATWRGEKVAG